MRLTPWRCDGERGCRNLLRIFACIPWAAAGCVVLALMVGTYWLGRWSR